MKIGSQDIVAVKLGDVDVDAVKVGDDFVFSSETVGGKWTHTGFGTTYVCDMDYQKAVGKEILYGTTRSGYVVKKCWYNGTEVSTQNLCITYSEGKDGDFMWHFIKSFSIDAFDRIKGTHTYNADNTTSKGAKYLNFGDGYEARWSEN